MLGVSAWFFAAWYRNDTQVTRTNLKLSFLINMIVALLNCICALFYDWSAFKFQSLNLWTTDHFVDDVINVVICVL